jgi:hypothetical protein
MVEEVPSGRVVWMEKPRWPGGPVLVSGGSMVRTVDGVSRCWPWVVKRPGMAEVGRARVGGGGAAAEGMARVEGDGERCQRESGWARAAQRRKMETKMGKVRLEEGGGLVARFEDSRSANAATVRAMAMAAKTSRSTTDLAGAGCQPPASPSMETKKKIAQEAARA